MRILRRVPGISTISYSNSAPRTFQCLSCEVAQPHSEICHSDDDGEIDGKGDDWLMDRTEPTDDGNSDTENSTALSALVSEDEETNPSKFLTAIGFA